jgi:hypothetical protein
MRGCCVPNCPLDLKGFPGSGAPASKVVRKGNFLVREEMLPGLGKVSLVY